MRERDGNSGGEKKKRCGRTNRQMVRRLERERERELREGERVVGIFSGGAAGPRCHKTLGLPTPIRSLVF